MRKYNCNDNFFSEDNERSFYWAGFIAADGCVRIKESKYSKVKCLEIRLSEKDKDHLEKFKIDIKAENPVHTYKNSSHFVIYSSQIFDDLARFGIAPNKTHNMNFPEWIKNHELVKHFLRGYFDGDGGFYFNTSIKNNNFMTLRICGTLSFLKGFKEVLEKGSDFISPSKPYMYNGQGALNYTGNIRCSKIASFLYDNSDIYLQRKFDQAQYAKSLRKRRDRPTKDVLIKLYKELKSTKNVGEALGYSQSGVALMMREYDLAYLYKGINDGSDKK